MTRAPKRNNARLEWMGHKLMCNGECIAEILLWGDRWSISGWSIIGYFGEETRKTEAAARRAVSRRFGMEDVE